MSLRYALLALLAEGESHGYRLVKELGARLGPPMRDEIFVRVLAAERLGAPAILAQVERHEQEYRRYLALLEEQGGRFGSMARELAYEAALAHAHAHLLWLTRCREVVSRPVVSAAS
jgi:hypothetical protein